MIIIRRAVPALAAAACLMLAGCASLTSLTMPTATPDKSTASAETLHLANTSWMLPLPKGSQCEVPPMIEFSDTQASGDLGCNRFTGSVKIDGNRIAFDQVAVTMKMCAPQYMALESQMLNMLNHARSATQTKDSLTFFDEDGQKLLQLVPEVAGACD